MHFQIVSIHVQCVPPPQKVNEKSKGEGGGCQKLKFLKKSIELNWNFWRGRGGMQTKNFPLGGGGGVGYFLEPHILKNTNYMNYILH